MPKAIVVQSPGGPEVLVWQDQAVGSPGPGEARVRHTKVGLNFIDVYFRTGVYPVPGFPYCPGQEAAGIVEAVGPGVSVVKPGDRVAYVSRGLGAYAEVRTLPAEFLVQIPEGVDDETAAAMMLKGMTAQYLLLQTRPIVKGETILIHAATGGVGLIACQWARHLGARVIGTVGSEEKAALARSHGCDEVIHYGREDIVARVRELTNGKGVPVVYDGVGQATFEASLDCLCPRGLLVMFGQSSGKVPPFDITRLSAKGSLFLTRPVIFTHIATRAALEMTAASLFDVVRQGAVKIEIHQRYALSDAAQAHRDLEARRTTGSTVFSV
jgi:NADPH:quinone reductase